MWISKKVESAMIDFDYMPNWLRWMLFIPAVPFTSIVFYLFANFSFEMLFEYTPNATLQYIIIRIFYNLIGIYMCIYVSVSIIPKGKVILASVFLGIIILLMGFSSASYLFYGFDGGGQVWQLLYEIVLSIASGITALVLTIKSVKDTQSDQNHFADSLEA